MSHVTAGRKPGGGLWAATTVLDVLGASLVVAGVWSWSGPAGLVAAGAAVLTASWRTVSAPRSHG